MRKWIIDPKDAVVGEVLLRYRIPSEYGGSGYCGLIPVTVERLTPTGCWAGRRLYTARSRRKLYRADDAAAVFEDQRQREIWHGIKRLTAHREKPPLKADQWRVLAACVAALDGDA